MSTANRIIYEWNHGGTFVVSRSIPKPSAPPPPAWKWGPIAPDGGAGDAASENDAASKSTVPPEAKQTRVDDEVSAKTELDQDELPKVVDYCHGMIEPRVINRTKLPELKKGGPTKNGRPVLLQPGHSKREKESEVGIENPEPILGNQSVIHQQVNKQLEELMGRKRSKNRVGVSSKLYAKKCLGTDSQIFIDGVSNVNDVIS